MTITNIILDFDGTLTDLYAEAQGFETEWRRLFAERTGLREDVLTMLANSMTAQVAADPRKGWNRDGQIVAPATADPYIRTTVVYQEILEGLQSGRIKMVHRPLPATTERIDDFFEELYRAAYAAKKDTTFRPGTKEFLDTLIDSYEVVVVTNSDSTKVSEKMRGLGDSFGSGKRQIEIIGNARKQVNNPGFDEVPASMRIERFGRDILLRREHYHGVLTTLMSSGFYPHNTAIIGDIFEFDLAMPLSMGYWALQMETRGTLPHEKRFHQGSLKSCLVHGYAQALQAIRAR